MVWVNLLIAIKSYSSSFTAMKNMSLSYLPWKCIFGSLIAITVNKSPILLEWRGKDNLPPPEKCCKKPLDAIDVQNIYQIKW
jgi:hypothetical protein